MGPPPEAPLNLPGRTMAMMLAALCSFIFLSTTAFAHGEDTAGLEARRAHFKEMLAEEWEYELRESPEQATTVGDYRYNDRWDDISLGHVQVRKQDALKWISRFQAVDTSAFPEQEKLSQLLMLRNLKERVKSIDFKRYEMPVDQIGGLQLQIPEFVTLIPFDSTKHYEDYIARLHRMPAVIDDLIAVLEQGKKDKLMPPRFLLEKTVGQCRSIAGAGRRGERFRPAGGAFSGRRGGCRSPAPARCDSRGSRWRSSSGLHQAGSLYRCGLRPSGANRTRSLGVAGRRGSIPLRDSGDDYHRLGSRRQFTSLA